MCPCTSSSSSPRSRASPRGKMIGPSHSDTSGMSLLRVQACATMLTGFV